MNIFRKIFTLTLLTAISMLVAAQPIDPSTSSDDSIALASQRRDLEIGRSMETFFNIFRETNLYYVDTISPSKMITIASDAMLNQLDPYTVYLPREKMDEFKTWSTGRYAGLGTMVRRSSDLKWIEIAEPYRGTPSDKAGLKAGDRILAVNGVDMKSREVSYASKLMTGKVGETVTLVIRPITDTTTTRTVTIKRQYITVPTVPYYGWIKSGTGDSLDSVGYIRLDNFTENCAADVRSALKDLQSQTVGDSSLRGLILDLRNNPGGIVTEAVKIVGLFTPRNTPVVSMRGRMPNRSENSRTIGSPIAHNVPLAVLINSQSASASEIVAGAMQDLDRAVIIGKRSFGKGLVQSTYAVGKDEFIKLTIAKYYIPSGRCIQAVDYSHRNDDGSVGNIPDSLISVFRTTSGRTVYDGGGIMPDVRIEAEYYSKFTSILIGIGYISDFANLYAVKHPAVTLNGEFAIDDSTYASFCRFIEDKDIDFESATERQLKRLRKAAEGEKYADRIAAELDAIADKIKDDKTAELLSCDTEIRNLLADAIITSWHYNAGRIEHQLLRDKKTFQAAEILLDRSKYTQIVTIQNTDKK